MKKAFTLTEALIVLTIIGVIAVLTVPTIIENSSKKMYVTQLQHTYNNLRTSLVNYLKDNEAEKVSQTPMGVQFEYSIINNVTTYSACPPSIGESDSAACASWAKGISKNAVAPFMLGYLDVAVDCTTLSEEVTCVGSGYTNMKSEAVTFPDSKASCVLLNSGVSVCMVNSEAVTVKKTAISKGGTVTKLPVRIYLDVNGVKGPNILGRDAFTLQITDDGKIGERFTDTGIPNANPDECTTSSNGLGCFTKIIDNNWAMNY